jgi:phospholipid N-methyltransferase
MPHRERGTRERLKGLGRFLVEAARHWKETGAVLPSSRRLALAMTATLPHHAERRFSARIIEVGAGTGVMTAEIVRKMGENDTLVVYELSERLAGLLIERAHRNPLWRSKKIEIRASAFPEGALEERYDFAICSLPFNNFPAPLVKRCFEAFERSLAGGGSLSFFEYCHLRRLKSTVADRGEFIRIQRIERTLHAYLVRHQVSVRTIGLNVPPAWVHTLKFD